jgi:hypothetical protein
VVQHIDPVYSSDKDDQPFLYYGYTSTSFDIMG